MICPHCQEVIEVEDGKTVDNCPHCGEDIATSDDTPINFSDSFLGGWSGAGDFNLWED